MNDRELLELAAKAAGLELRYYEFAGYSGMIDDDAENGLWNPLTDDGDALRLAVKLAMEIDAGYSDKFIQARTPGGGWVEVVAASSPELATRRAIVCAAAEIGKAMK